MKSTKFLGVIKNAVYALGAQGVSVMLSIFLALVFPRLLGVHQYSYWRLFSLYVGYAYVVHLGLNDGVYLRNGGKEYKDLDFPGLKSNLLLSVIWQLVFGILLLWTAIGFGEMEQERVFVIVCTAIYILLSNVIGFLHYILQATNRIKEFSGAVLIEKLCFLMVVVAGIIIKCGSLKLYICSFILARVIAAGYSFWLCKDIVKCTCASWARTFREMIENISCGLSLMVSNFTSMLLLGTGQFIIDGHWGVEIFGMLSLALSLSEFFVVFISQTSVVLFPEFRRMEKEALSNSYRALRTGLGALLLLALLGYLPMCVLVELWLPQYKECLRYLILLFPICIFDGKMGMLCNTYYKTLRKEKELLIINFFSLMLGTLLYALAAFVLDNILLVVVCMTIVVGLRSIVAEWYLAILFEKSTLRARVWELVLIGVFVLSTWFLGPVWGFVLYAVMYMVFCLSYRKQLFYILKYGRIK